MALILAASINLNEIPKDKIIIGKKGKYLPISITLNDELDQFGNQGPVIVSQSKEERAAKQAKTYLGNVKLVWTNGEVKKFDNTQQQAAPPVPQHQNVLEDDLPF
jgi:hypothetical protein